MNRLLKAVHALGAIGLVFVSSYSVVAMASFNDVVVNGKQLDAAQFHAYKRHGIVEAYCYPHTDDLVLQRVIQRHLLIQAGQASGLKDDNLSEELNDIQQQLKALSNNEYDTELRRAIQNYAFANESGFYLDKLSARKQMQSEQEIYLSLLASNDELVVDVMLLRTAKLLFHYRSEAEAALMRIKKGESIDSIAAELEQDGEAYEASKSMWMHSGFTSTPIEEKPIEVDQPLRIWFDNGKWHVQQTLEVKHAPVLLLSDVINGDGLELEQGIANYAERQAQDELIQKLWLEATISVDGELLAYKNESYCGFPTLSDNFSSGFR